MMAEVLSSGSVRFMGDEEDIKLYVRQLIAIIPSSYRTFSFMNPETNQYTIEVSWFDKLESIV